MKKRNLRRNQVRAEPNSSVKAWLCSSDVFESLVCQGYTTLAHSPEVATAVDVTAKLVASMTIHLMENTNEGDIRVKNALARKIDINPNNNMTRSTFIQWLVKTLYIEGEGNAVVYPELKEGLLNDLKPIPASVVSFQPLGLWNYKIMINGKTYSPDDMLHFVLNPSPLYPWKGIGYRAVLKDIANNLKQAAATEKGFMESKWKPSLIVKVDALTEEFASPEGRKRLLDEYIKTNTVGEPWLIPAEQFQIEQVKPLSLNDLALKDTVELDKRTVASILGVPPFVLGVGDFNREAWNNFITSKIMPLAKSIEQELTRKLLINPEWYFRFNARSLYNYELKDLSDIADNQYVRGIMSGNEVRDWLSLPPREGLDDLVILENYIPRGMIGEQSKLNGGGE